jgi:hypothetical protein
MLLRSTFLVSLYVLLGAYRLTPSGGAAHAARIKWIVDKTSTLSIAGQTNINKFCCEVTEYTGPDTLMTLKETGSTNTAGVLLKGALKINIEDFDCRNRVMTSEFKHTLKYHQYPQLVISFLTLEKLPSPNVENKPIKGWVEVELAGANRKFEIAYTSCLTEPGCVALTGTRTFGFSDFGLQPPRKMAGLVRVDDQLNVQFRLHLHQIY